MDEERKRWDGERGMVDAVIEESGCVAGND